MRLISISLEGFQAYRDPVCLDLADITLAAVIGPNGIGKSSLVVDAVMFALFGKSRTQTLDGVISTGRASAEVSLVFLLAGSTYRATRKVERRRRAVVHKASFHQQDPLDPQLWIPLAQDDVTPTNREITTRLGMDYRTFCATVFARQGKADDFASAAPQQRREILVGALGLDRYAPLHERAKKLLNDADTERRVLSARLDEIEQALADTAATADTDIGATEALLVDARDSSRRAHQNLVAYQDDAEYQSEMRRMQDRLAELVEVDTGRRRQAATLVRQNRRHVAGLVVTADEQQQALDAAVHAQSHRAQLLDVLASVTGAEHQCSADQANVRRAGETARALNTRIEAELVSFSERLTAIQERQASLHRANQVGTEACYTCGQRLSTTQANQLREQLQQDLNQTRAQAAHLQSQRGRTQQELARHGAEYRRLDRELQQHRERRRDTEQELTRATVAAEAVDRLRQALATTNARLVEARGELHDATAAEQALLTDPRIDEARRLLQQQQAAAPDPQVRRQLVEAVAGAEQRVSDLLAELLRCRHNQDQVRLLQAKHADLTQSLHKIQTRVDRLTVLKEAFHSTGIPTMILNSVIDELNRDVQEQLSRLSDGDLTVELVTQSETARGCVKDQIDLVITGGDAEGRYYESYSGGQRLRVDLALRAGLAKVLARRTGVPIETFTLDEGWGSLDEAGIKAAADMLRVLSEDFLVLTVSHLPAVYELFPTVVEVVDRGGTSVPVVRQ